MVAVAVVVVCHGGYNNGDKRSWHLMTTVVAVDDSVDGNDDYGSGCSGDHGGGSDCHDGDGLNEIF